MTRRPVVLPIEDDSTYLTVVHPYPLNANLQLPADRRGLALWLACCTGKQDVLRAMFQKPKAAGMVIIEVDREFKGLDALLGMHSWSEFLLAPTNEEVDKSSKMFFCTYNDAKAVKDAGWNRVDIEEHWFQGWRLDNDRIKHPYPKTAYCDLPPMPKTEVPICRHLPRRFFPVIPPQQEPPAAPQVDDYSEDDAPRRSTAVAMMDMFGTAPDTAFIRSRDIPRGIEEGASTAGVIPIRDQSHVDDEAVVEDNPWDGYDVPRPDPPTRVKKRGEEDWVCPQHGPMCTPGICKALARVEREERWQKEREEREETKRRWRERREKRTRKREMKLMRDEGREVPRDDQPARLVNVPRKGVSGSSETEGGGLHDQGTGFPTSSDTDPIVAAVQTPQTSSAQTRSIGADGFQASAAGDGDGDGDEIEIERMHVQGRNEGKGKGKGKQKLIQVAAFGDAQTSEPEFEKVLLPGGIGQPWCEPSVEW